MVGTSASMFGSFCVWPLRMLRCPSLLPLLFALCFLLAREAGAFEFSVRNETYRLVGEGGRTVRGWGGGAEEDGGVSETPFGVVSFLSREARRTRTRRRREYDVIAAEGWPKMGGFGTVFQVKRDSDQKIFALKMVEGDPGDKILSDLVEKELGTMDDIGVKKVPFSMGLEERLSSCPADAVGMVPKGRQYKRPLCMVLEMLSGGELFAKLQELSDGTVGPSFQASHDIRSWLKQSLAALHFIHEAGYIHYDIKPENILLRADGTLQLADFGLAQDGPASTSTGGTFNYMPPEVWELKFRRHRSEAPLERLDTVTSVSYGSDLWALGVAFYELCTGGEFPFLYHGWTKYAKARPEILKQSEKDIRISRAYQIGRNVLNSHGRAFVYEDKEFTFCHQWDMEKSGVEHLAENIVRDMLTYDPSERPPVSEVIKRVGPEFGQTPSDVACDALQRYCPWSEVLKSSGPPSLDPTKVFYNFRSLLLRMVRAHFPHTGSRGGESGKPGKPIKYIAPATVRFDSKALGEGNFDGSEDIHDPPDFFKYNAPESMATLSGSNSAFDMRKIDVFSLGVFFFELCTGVHPFWSAQMESKAAWVKKDLKNYPETPENFRQRIKDPKRKPYEDVTWQPHCQWESKEGKVFPTDLILQMISKEPFKRPSSVKALESLDYLFCPQGQLFQMNLQPSSACKLSLRY